MKNSRMNTKVNALIQKVEGVQTQTVEILGQLKSWKSYPNESASTDGIIEKALNGIIDLWKNVAEMGAEADKVRSLHTNDVAGMIADQMSNRPISRKNYK